jgi:hypothetical protein
MIMINRRTLLKSVAVGSVAVGAVGAFGSVEEKYDLYVVGFCFDIHKLVMKNVSLIDSSKIVELHLGSRFIDDASINEDAIDIVRLTTDAEKVARTKAWLSCPIQNPVAVTNDWMPKQELVGFLEHTYIKNSIVYVADESDIYLLIKA